MSAFFKLYSKALHLHPWKTQLLTTGFLMGSSDIIAQTLIERRNFEQIQFARVARFAFLGTFYVGPVLKVWYLVLERTFGSVGKTVGLKKMLCDQFLFVPCFLGTILTVIGIVQFQPWSVVKEKVKNEYLTVLKTSYLLWPGAQLITFYFIPFQMRIVFVNSVALVWNTYLAYQANKCD